MKGEATEGVERIENVIKSISKQSSQGRIFTKQPNPSNFYTHREDNMEEATNQICRRSDEKVGDRTNDFSISNLKYQPHFDRDKPWNL